VAPQHTHPITADEVKDCELCQSHGSPLDGTDVDEDFEVILSPQRSLRARLQGLMTQTYDEDEEDDTENAGCEVEDM